MEEDDSTAYLARTLKRTYRHKRLKRHTKTQRGRERERDAEIITVLPEYVIIYNTSNCEVEPLCNSKGFHRCKMEVMVKTVETTSAFAE